MTHFLRTNNNETVVDIETTDDDIRTVIDIKEYSKLLLSLDSSSCVDNCINDFSQLQDIRGLWFEMVNVMNITPQKFVEQVLRNYAAIYGLFYIVD